MNRIEFGPSACEKTRKYMDSYISNELLVETNHEVLRHIENCPACAAEMEARTKLRNRLKSAVRSQDVPARLQAQIRQQIRSGRSRSWLTPGWGTWALAVAASLAICTGIWVNYFRLAMPDIADRKAQYVYIQNVSAKLAAVLKVGLGDHVHCSVFRQYPQNPPPVESMESDLGPSYKGLLPVVRAAVPKGYRVITAHRCGFAGRRFTHLTLKKGEGLLSLVITRRNPGETVDRLSPAVRPSGVPIYQAAADRYQVAGFEAGNFLAYVVSDLRGKANLQIAAGLAPSVREFLLKMPA